MFIYACHGGGSGGERDRESIREREREWVRERERARVGKRERGRQIRYCFVKIFIRDHGMWTVFVFFFIFLLFIQTAAVPQDVAETSDSLSFCRIRINRDGWYEQAQ